MRIAIVGAGISGLVAAHLLHEQHEITVFEASAYAGGHTNTIRVDTAYETHDVDTGFIVFNDRNYPEFTQLLSKLGVDHQPSQMSFAVADETGDFEYSSGSLGGLFAKASHAVSPTFQRMVVDYVRFNKKARELLADPSAGSEGSLRDWLGAPAPADRPPAAPCPPRCSTALPRRRPRGRGPQPQPNCVRSRRAS